MDSIPQHKQCVRCNTLKPRSEFRKQTAQHDGLHPWCKACCVAYAKAYYHKTKPQRKVEKRRSYERHRDSYLARAKAAYQRNREHRIQYADTWTKAHRAQRRLYERRMYAKNPEPKRETWRRRKALKLAVSVGSFSAGQLKAKIAYWGWRCWICGAPYQEVDHVKPLNKGGYHVLCNLRPICIPCNRRKADQWPFP